MSSVFAMTPEWDGPSPPPRFHVALEAIIADRLKVKELEIAGLKTRIWELEFELEKAKEVQRG